MKGINKVILVGTLGKDPETRYFPNGDAVTNISLATSESWTDKASGEKKESTEWHAVVFRKKLAEIAGQYLKKGSKVYVEGSLRTRKWQDKDTGKDRFTTEIIVNDMQMLDSKPQQDSATPSRGKSRRAPAANPAPSNDGFEDDSGIPF